MDAAAEGGVTVLQLGAILVALALVVAGAGWFWHYWQPRRPPEPPDEPSGPPRRERPPDRERL